MRFYNHNIETIVTPVDANKLESLLHESEYDEEETRFLVNGFKNGFHIGYEGPINRKNTSKNLPTRVGNKTILWNKLMKEVKEKRVAGPYSTNNFPFKQFVQSPLGLVPKGENKTRMIFHLSYDFKNSDGTTDYSINSYIPEECSKTKYNDIDTAVKYSLNLDSSKILFYGKTNLSNAFRTAPTSRSS